MEIDHEIFSTVTLPLIQEGQLFMAKECTQVLVKRLEDKASPDKRVVRLTDHPRHDPKGLTYTYIYIIRFWINVQVQGQHPHQWAPFQIAGMLHAWQISHQISRYVYHEG